MQLETLEVKGLFGRFNHTVNFPRTDEETPTPSVVILHGPNGVGKTTLLRMLSGLMRLDFDIFRMMPFERCTLTFSTSEEISVTHKPGPGTPLRVSFRGDSVALNPRRKGALDPKNELAVEEFRRAFFEATEAITFNLIDTGRRPRQELETALLSRQIERPEDMPSAALRRYLRDHPEEDRPLASRVQHFIRDAQVYSRRFFEGGPDLFSRILQRLGADESAEYHVPELLAALEEIQKMDQEHARLGLEPDRWNYEELITYLRALDLRQDRSEALTFLGAYTELLKSRSKERQLVAQRLLSFERIMASFLLDKRVQIDPREGIRIITLSDERLNENQLSSGEYHLLFLMVSALVTTRRGTVIAIDEPEMSMHIAWQRQLIDNLIEAASNAAPQFLFATHSPDISANYRQCLVELGAPDSEDAS